MNSSYEEHPFSAFYYRDIQYLIVGSFPPIKLTNKIFDDDNLKTLYEGYLKTNPFREEKDIKFYYGSSDNYFWSVLRTIYKERLSNTEDIKQFLQRKYFGITDLFEKCRRKIRNEKIDSADSNLVVLENRDLNIIFNECRGLKKIYFTSKWVFKKFIKLYPESPFDLVILESPSGAYDRNIGRIDEYKQKKSINKDYNCFTYRLDKYKEKLPE